MQIRAPKINRRWPYSMAVLLLTLSVGLSAVVASGSDDDTVSYDPDITPSKCVTTLQEELPQTKASSPKDKEEENGHSSSFTITFDPSADLKGLQPDSARPPQTPWHTPASAGFLATSLANDPAEFEPKK